MSENRWALRKDKLDPRGPVVITVKLHMAYAHLAERVAVALKNSCWGCVEVEIISRPANNDAPNEELNGNTV